MNCPICETKAYKETKMTHDIIRKVASHLENWKMGKRFNKNDFRWPSLVNNQGAELYCNYDSYKKRIEISGSFPREAYPITEWEDEKLKITVAYNKNPALIARDIERRLEPQYLRVFGEVTERVKVWDASRQKAKETMTDIAGILGEEGGGHKDRPKVHFSSAKDDGYGDIFTGNGESFTIELRSVPFKVARKIAKILAKG